MNLKNETQTLPPPPGIIGSLKAGFDVIAAHIIAIAFPLALDLLLWLGPHISINQLIQPVLAEFRSFASGMPVSLPATQERDGYVHPVLSTIQFAGRFADLSHRRTELDERRDASSLSIGCACNLAG